MVARRKNTGRGIAARVACAVVVSCALVASAGYGIASAGSTADADTFGVGSATISVATADADESASDAVSAVEFEATEPSALESTASRDISRGVDEIEARKEAERRAAEEAARIEEEQHIAAAQQARADQAATSGLPALSEIDWSVGKEAFIAEWTERIDAYLSGSPLYGYGATFAEAAWEYGVDPRFSPAISNTESSKGAVCFRAYNAWGWMGDTAWSSWEESIYAHIAGLASGYGYTISEWAASKYCPPTWQDWYAKTLYQMTLI